jgi:hypothetical protein
LLPFSIGKCGKIAGNDYHFFDLIVVPFVLIVFLHDFFHIFARKFISNFFKDYGKKQNYIVACQIFVSPHGSVCHYRLLKGG